MRDGLGRTITYLRVSLTDRCNLKCRYCVPAAQCEYFTPEGELLSLEEIHRVIQIFAALGISRVRFTGGEPLLRKGSVGLMERIISMPGIQEVTLTTNGTLLADFSGELRRAGVTRVNVSLDSLNRRVYRSITGRDELYSVLNGIESARREGLVVKLNVVIIKGQNHEEMLDFLNFSRETGIRVRFIELVETGSSWSEKGYMSEKEMLKFLKCVTHVAYLRSQGVENVYSSSRPGVEFGIIPARTRGFCGECNRIRLTSSGKLRLCLYSPLGPDIKKMLREGKSDAEIAAALRRSLFSSLRETRQKNRIFLRQKA